MQDRVRAVTNFALHNLLEPAAGGPYDLVLCRNVLVYFSPPAIRSASQHLAAELFKYRARLDIAAVPYRGTTAFLPDLLRQILSSTAASTAAPALSSMLIYLLMAIVLVVRPEGLFPAGKR